MPRLTFPTPGCLIHATEETDSGIRNDQALRVHASRLLRGLRILHYFRTPGQVHSVTLKRVHHEGGRKRDPNARFQGIYIGFGRSLRQHVRHGRPKPRHLPEMLPPVMSASGRLPESIQRPPATARHLPGSGQNAGGQEIVYRERSARYDLAMARNNDENVNAANREYLRTLIADHVSGRLKVAPEHTSDAVLQCMRKTGVRAIP